MGFLSWLQEPAPRPRRTSRPRKPKGPPKRTSRSTKRGYLNIDNVKARAYTGRSPDFRGRIQLQRGTGFTEFPDYEQFKRIAREEKVPSGDVEIAFGHMDASKPKAPRRTKKKKTSRKSPRRRSTRRRTSRQRRVRRNVSRPTRFVEKGKMAADYTLDGRPMPIRVHEVDALTQKQRSIYGQKVLLVETAGETKMFGADRTASTLTIWFTAEEIQRGLGHLLRGYSGRYGGHSIKLGHRDGPSEGPPRAGIVRGQLVLFHKPTGQVIWEAWDDSRDFPHKPVWVWYEGRSAHFDVEDVVRGAQVGRGVNRIPASATDLDIPPMAILTAFDHLLSPKERRSAYEALSRKP